MSSLYVNGYVHSAIDERQGATKFLLSYASMYGMCIMQRDEPGDQLPRHSNTSEHHRVGLAQAKEAQAQFNALSRELQDELLLAEQGARIQNAKECLAKQQAEIDYCKDLLFQVKAWDAPADLSAMKQDAIEAVAKGAAETLSKYYIEELKELPVEELRARKITDLSDDVAMYTKSLQEAIERDNRRNALIDALYKSLGLEYPLEGAR